MNELLDITINNMYKNKPKKVAKMIVKLADEINECENDLNSLKDRGIFKRMVSNNTKDIVEVMIKQNNSISLFLNIIQGLINLNMNNLVVLNEIQKEITLQEKERASFQNQYINMAKEYVAASYDNAYKLNKKIEGIKKNNKILLIGFSIYGVASFIAILMLFFSI